VINSIFNPCLLPQRLGNGTEILNPVIMGLVSLATSSIQRLSKNPPGVTSLKHKVLLAITQKILRDIETVSDAPITQEIPKVLGA
jgi:hypothetical protein